MPKSKGKPKADLDKLQPMEMFGCKLGLVIKRVKDTVQYVIVKEVKPVKEMLVRYGTCHKACARDYISQKDPITGEEGMIQINIDCGLFGLDRRGQLRQGVITKVPHPKGLLFDGFEGVEMVTNVKFRPWHVKNVNGKVQWAGEDQEHTYYPYKESLVAMPDEQLLYGDKVLIPATDAVSWMKRWLSSTKLG